MQGSRQSGFVSAATNNITRLVDTCLFMSPSADHNDANALHGDNQGDWGLLDNCPEGRQFWF
jgi:hypothetical protein